MSPGAAGPPRRERRMTRHSKDVGLDGDPEDGPCAGCRGAGRRLWVPGPLVLHAGPAAPCGKPGTRSAATPKTRGGALQARQGRRRPRADVRRQALHPRRGREDDDPGRDRHRDEQERLEHAAGILIDEKGVPRFTRVVYGVLDEGGRATCLRQRPQGGRRIRGDDPASPRLEARGRQGTRYSRATSRWRNNSQRTTRPCSTRRSARSSTSLTSKQNRGKGVAVFDVARDTVTVVE